MAENRGVINVSRIDLNLLVVLDAIYTERGITRASERLNLTQPAVSHALARLRELLDDPLFVRDGNTMTPTATAHELIEPVRRALNEIESSLNRLQRFDPAASTRHFKIGMRHVVESSGVPEFVRRVRAQAPHVQLSSLLHERQTLASALASGELDAALDMLLPPAPNVSHARLAGGRMVVAVRRDHPRVGNELDLATYLELEHVLASSRRSGPGLEDVALQRIGRERRVVLRCQHHWTACQVVASTDLVYTMAEHYAAAVNAALGNRLLPFPLDVPANELYLYWHANLDADPANRWLRGLLQACYGDGQT